MLLFLSPAPLPLSCSSSSLLLQSIGADQVRVSGVGGLRQWQRGDASHGGLSRGSVLPHAVSAGRGLRALPRLRLQELGSPETGHPELAAATLQEQHGGRGGGHVGRGLPDHRVRDGDVGAGQESRGRGAAVRRALPPPRQGRVPPEHRWGLAGKLLKLLVFVRDPHTSSHTLSVVRHSGARSHRLRGLVVVVPCRLPAAGRVEFHRLFFKLRGGSDMCIYGQHGGSRPHGCCSV